MGVKLNSHGNNHNTVETIKLPSVINTVEELEELLSTPYPETIRDLGEVEGDIMVLGAGGKIGPSLVMTAAKAVKMGGLRKRIIAVSRFTRNDELVSRLRGMGVEVIRADLTNEDDVARLPDVENIIFMVGRKFGTANEPELTWITNTYVPALVARRFPRARFIVFSTGNVYPLVPIYSGGATEETKVAPIGEYAYSALARERVFNYFFKINGNRAVIIRLNYAVELRYGVLLDIALKVLKGEPIDLTMGYVNVIWQGDVNNIVLRALKYASNPPLILNVTGPEIVSVRWVAEEFGKLLGRKPVFMGNEADTALLSNAAKAFELFGYPRVTLLQMIKWIASWVKGGKPIYNLPTHYEVRTGEF